jgi:uncharacterized protein YneF (UPF0154 family)
MMCAELVQIIGILGIGFITGVIVGLFIARRTVNKIFDEEMRNL